MNASTAILLHSPEPEASPPVHHYPTARPVTSFCACNSSFSLSPCKLGLLPKLLVVVTDAVLAESFWTSPADHLAHCRY